MVGTPKPPLRYRRRESSDYRIHSQDLDLPFHPSAASYSFAPEHSMPYSPSFYSSSSVAPSSPVRSLYTPEPSSSPITEPFIASSPKSPTFSGRKGFWEVAFNYGPDFPYKARPSVQNSNFSREQFITRRRSSSASAPPLVSDADPSDYSEDIDPFHMDDDITDEENGPGNITIASPKNEMIAVGGRDSHLPHDDIAETRALGKLLPGEIDVAAVLLDLSRPVRFAPVKTEAGNIEIKPKLSVPLDLTQPSSILSDVSAQAEDETRSFIPSSQESPVSPPPCDVAATKDIEVSNAEDVPGCGTYSETIEVYTESSKATTDVFVDDTRDQRNCTEDGASQKHEHFRASIDLSSENVAVAAQETGTNVVLQSCSGAESSPNDEGCVVIDEKKIDPIEESIYSCTLTPISSPSFAGSELSDLTELLSEPPSPRHNHVHEFTGPGDTRHLRESDLDLLSGPSSSAPGPSKSQSGANNQHDAPTERKSDQFEKVSTDGKARSVDGGKVTRVEPEWLDPTGKKKRARSQSSAASRSSSPHPPASCSVVPKQRKKRTKRAGEDSVLTRCEYEVQVMNLPSLPSTSITSSCASSVPLGPQRDIRLLATANDGDADAKAEMCGCLIQTMALSRASSMPASSLVREVLRENPHLANQRSKSDLLGIASVVLESNNVFGRIERVGFDADDKPLEAQWFYVPENDPDQERALLLREMMPKKRTETKKHKQYFFKPLGKISRWDPEDAL